MKTSLVISLFLFSASAMAQSTKYAKKTWCTGLANNEVYDHIKNAVSINCPNEWPQPQKSYTRYIDTLNNQSSENQEDSGASR